jgi:hypothetical protein
VTAGVRQRNRGIDGRTWLAWSLAALSVAMFVVGAALTVSSLYVGAAPQPSTASTWGTAGALSSLVIFLPFLAFPLVGALIASRRPENPIGWICLAAGLFWMSIVVEASIPGSASYPVIIDALLQWTWVPPVGLLGIYMILLFPDGKLPSRRWHPFAWFAGAVMVLTSVAVTLSPGPLEDHPGVSNPLGLEGHSIVAQVLARAPVLLPICILASALSLVWRYRHSGGEVRLQIRWVAFAASLVSVAYAVTAVSGIFFAPEASTNEQAPPLWLALLQDAVLVSYAGVPIAVGFAVLRYRLYDIDLIINRTLVYGSLTVLLASRFGVRRWRGRSAGYLPRPHRPGVHPRSRGLHAGDSSVVQPAAPSGADVRGPALLPQEVRREKDPGNLLRQATRRDRPPYVEQRPGSRGQGDDAAGARVTVGASRTICSREKAA